MPVYIEKSFASVEEMSDNDKWQAEHHIRR